MKTTLLLRIAALFLCASIISCSSSTRTTSSTYNPYGTTTYSSVITPPSWAPASGDISAVRYYFLSDCDAYFDAASQQYMYNSGGSWISSTTLPPGCSSLDLNNAYVVEL